MFGKWTCRHNAVTCLLAIIASKVSGAELSVGEHLFNMVTKLVVREDALK